MSNDRNISTLDLHTEERNFFRYALVVEYNGSSYAGSQKQPGLKTVQSELESALSILLKTEVKTIFSGRTDAGVHARGQVVHFDSNSHIDTYKFLHSLNAILPPDISVNAMFEVDKIFHSQKSALYRWYRYTINNKANRSVWLQQAVNIHQKLDIDEMNKALSYIVGNHDFSSFRSSKSDNPARECNVYYAECKEEAGIIYIDIVANRFLYNMVRIIIGTLVEIGKGSLPAEHMLDVLNAKDRTQAGVTARAEGLTLMSVNYGKNYNISMNMEAINDENLLCKAS